MDDIELNKIHKLANEKLYKDFPCLDMANLEKHPEGSIKKYQIEYILEVYNNGLSNSKQTKRKGTRNKKTMSLA